MLIVGKAYQLDKTNWKVNISESEGIFLGFVKVMKDYHNITTKTRILVNKEEDTTIICSISSLIDPD